LEALFETKNSNLQHKLPLFFLASFKKDMTIITGKG